MHPAATTTATATTNSNGTNYTAAEAVGAQHQCYPRCIQCVFDRATLGYKGSSIDACYSCGKACQDCVAEEIMHHGNDTNKRGMKAGIARCECLCGA